MKKISFLLILLNISLEIVAQTSFGVTNGNSDVNMGKSGSGSENHIGMNLFKALQQFKFQY
ncbi:MAG: hypothetical protein IPN26_08705 [Bacteroidetes bacterium]|nr:hypothetical protein [Bacteroidota bacterium]